MISRCLLLLLWFASPGCATTPRSDIRLPDTTFRDGVRLEVTGLNRVAGQYTAVTGEVSNTSAQTVGCSISFNVIGQQGTTVAQATAEVDNLAPGETRKYRARFVKSVVKHLAAIRVLSLRVLPEGRRPY